MLKAQLVGGFNMLTYPSETYEFVSWDDDIPNWMESRKIPWFQITTKQWLINIAIKWLLDVIIQ